MSKIATCPLCGKKPKIILYKPQYEFGGEGKEIKTIKCCGVEIDFIDIWNKYTAAMEFAKAKYKRDSISRNVFGDWDEYY